jgi:CrcB protein
VLVVDAPSRGYSPGRIGRHEEAAVGRFVLVCIGGALGSGARYLVAVWATTALPLTFPFGTTIVNVVGCWFLGAVMDLSIRFELLGPDLRIFLATGVAGGFTTYSTFNWEAMRLLEGRDYGVAATYVLGTLLGCALGGLLGVATSRGAVAIATSLFTQG